jgi:hypothetical protein
MFASKMDRTNLPLFIDPGFLLFIPRSFPMFLTILTLNELNKCNCMGLHTQFGKYAFP